MHRYLSPSHRVVRASRTYLTWMGRLSPHDSEFDRMKGLSFHLTERETGESGIYSQEEHVRVGRDREVGGGGGGDERAERRGGWSGRR